MTARKPPPEKSRQLLHPAMLAIVEAVEADLGAAGLGFELYETYRGRARQEWGYTHNSKGQRVEPGKGTSRARWLASFHNWGLAVDFVRAAPAGKWERKTKADRAAWDGLGTIYKRHGLIWGGDWAMGDFPHGQLSSGPWAKPALKRGAFAARLPGLDPEARAAEAQWLGTWLSRPSMLQTEIYEANLQQLVADAGFDPGPVDGDIGPKSVAALLAFARDRTLDVGNDADDLTSAEVLVALLDAAVGDGGICSP